MAQKVVDSSSTGHPIYKGRHSNIYFYKTLIFGLRESLINICLVNIILEEMEMLTKEIVMMNLENRIALLSNRDPVGNARLINKAKRRLRKMRESV